ncbi:UNVERIFIED_ORG: hypothetical protein J2791_004282 [Burkholderia contaminans]|nr:hypothetical protein [Burkholderia contaminans]
MRRPEDGKRTSHGSARNDRPAIEASGQRTDERSDNGDRQGGGADALAGPFGAHVKYRSEFVQDALSRIKIEKSRKPAQEKCESNRSVAHW